MTRALLQFNARDRTPMVAASAVDGQIPTVHLAGSRHPSGRTIYCCRCNHNKPAEGAVDVGPEKKACAMCWAHRKDSQRTAPRCPPTKTIRVRVGTNQLR